MSSTCALIIAKGESKRFPFKNSRNFKGKPLFFWNVEKCLSIFSRTYVSSDDNFILGYAEEKGAIPVKRPKELCEDTPNIPVYQHALGFMNQVDGIVAVQANSPTIDSKLIMVAKWLMEHGFEEIMTCHKDYSIYGSLWCISKNRLVNYKDPYKPKPEILIYDPSIDIHEYSDLLKAKQQLYE